MIRMRVWTSFETDSRLIMHHNTRNMKRQGQNSKDGDISDTKVAFLTSLQHNTPAPRHYNTHCKRRPSLTWTQASFTNSRGYDTMAHDTTTTTTSSFPSHRRNTINLTVFSASKRASFAVFVISWFYLLSTNARPCSLITRYQSFS